MLDTSYYGQLASLSAAAFAGATLYVNIAATLAYLWTVS